MKKIFILFLIVLSIPVYAQVEYTSRLAAKLEQMSNIEYAHVLCLLKDRVDINQLDERLYIENSSLEKRAYEVITQLQSKANTTQGRLKTYLNSKIASNEVKNYESFWITNLIMVEATKSVIQELMKDDEIEYMDLDAILALDPYTFESNAPQKVLGSETGLKVINADKLWKLGITGAGRLVMGIDTGVEGTHPALTERWRGNFVPANQAWFDPETGTTSPTDCDNHGTHTMGIMCGQVGGDTIGVAPDAQWIAAKTICSSPHTSKSISAFQWAMNPDGNPSTITDMPDAINNSWYDPNASSDQCTGIYKTTLDAVEAAGIAVVFSAGNNGPNASTITPPKNINTDLVNVFSVANVNGNVSGYPIANTSSRGPSTCGGTGSLLIKPEVSAPGTSIRSSIRGGTYGTLSGTSMASPHAVGAIALLKQFAPNLTGKQLKLALYNTAVDLGTVGEDNTYGNGIIDVYAAFLYLSSRDSIGPSTIADLSISNPGSNRLTLTWTAPSDTSPGGTAEYDLRYSTTGPILDTITFNSAVKLSGLPKPANAGSLQSFVVKGLNFNSTYYFAIRSRDVWSNWSEISNSASGTTLSKPSISVNPDSISLIKPKNITFSDSVVISNTSSTSSTLDFEVSLQNHTFPSKNFNLKLQPIVNVRMHPFGESMNASELKNDNKSGIGYSIKGGGGPDLYGYRWKDSDDPNGPQFTWNSISSVGTQITLADDAFSSQTLPFAFNFYGINYNSVEVVSNGYLRFTNYTTTYPTNGTIPNTSSPNNAIYGFWDDLNPAAGGNIYVFSDVVNGKFIVEYNDVPRYNNTTSRMTFQIELQRSGAILFRYKSMIGTLNSATVGIENSTGTDGLLVVYNSSYVKDSLAIKFQKEPDWLGLTTLSGTISNGNSLALIIQMTTNELIAGVYRMELKISSNDTSKSQIIVPIRMVVTDTSGLLTSTFSTSAGWNLISVPVQSILKNKNDLFPTSNSFAYGYNNSYVVRDTLEMGYGYWLKFPSSGIQSISGSPVGSANVQLRNGWNLIGSLHDSIQISSLTTNPPGILASYFYGYNGGYFIANSIQRGKGYWIKSSASGTLTLSSILSKNSLGENFLASVEQNWSSSEWMHSQIKVKDSDGKQMNLYLSNSSVEEMNSYKQELYELPPIPPSGMFDARFSNNKFVSDLKETNVINVSSPAYPIEIELVNSKSDFLVEDLINGEFVKQTLSQKQKVIISNPAIGSIRLTEVNKPISFSLEQNYPNPFNPITKIRFTIPTPLDPPNVGTGFTKEGKQGDSFVTLKVYDLLGREVAVLLNEPKNAGVYEIEFNAEKLSSGMYFYQLDAGKFSAVKKLILMK